MDLAEVNGSTVITIKRAIQIREADKQERIMRVLIMNKASSYAMRFWITMMVRRPPSQV